VAGPRQATTATAARAALAGPGHRLAPDPDGARPALRLGGDAQQLLDEQAQKVRESLHAALIGWAKQRGRGQRLHRQPAQQCLHPVGHWYEVPNLLRNGVLPACWPSARNCAP
jgi:hypothetical protein